MMKMTGYLWQETEIKFREIHSLGRKEEDHACKLCKTYRRK